MYDPPPLSDMKFRELCAELRDAAACWFANRYLIKLDLLIAEAERLRRIVTKRDEETRQ